MCLWTEKLIAEVSYKGCIGVCQAKEKKLRCKKEHEQRRAVWNARARVESLGQG